LAGKKQRGRQKAGGGEGRRHKVRLVKLEIVGEKWGIKEKKTRVSCYWDAGGLGKIEKKGET